jgi:hypothetical protein
MEAVFWHFLSAATLGLAWLAGNVPLDAAPPVALLAGLALAVLVIMGFILLVVVLAAVFVIRRVKKQRAKREQL